MKVKIDIISGFLGAGKTTLIKKLIEEEIYDEKIVIIENEFGEIGIDGTLLERFGLEIKEINSGCICCTLVGDFEKSIKEVIEKFAPKRIVIEPSGVGKLSEIIKACKSESLKNMIKINKLITVVDVERFNIHLLNFGEFFEDQIRYAKTILLSRTQDADSHEIKSVIASIRRLNKKANIITSPWEDISGRQIMALEESISISSKDSPILRTSLELKSYRYEKASKVKKNNHTASEIFQVWGIESQKLFNEKELEEILNKLNKEKCFGNILRGKGILKIGENQWIQFDYIPFKLETKRIYGDYICQMSIIGTELNKENLNKIFANIN